MQRIKRAATACAGCALISIVLPASSKAQSELETVREMLRLDAERALAQERARLPAQARPAARTAVARTDKISLSSLYGVAGKRRVVVYVNGDRKEYVEGSPAVRGHAKSTTDYRLVGIEDICVHLEKAGGRNARVACFVAGAPRAGAAVAAAPAQLLPPVRMGMPLEALPAVHPAR